ncbi:ATP-binding protein [Methylocystis parvus]|uniref:AAA family ATPase n=2 Tax=Methylocystis parvus TaxID=134 RepID=A0A6B8MB59_9HYPH|nr:ATP-binding protein [Methylocystis parvus]QGM99878.1 AAA family ATPase [Methylocystis parvus]WBK02301.1 AAA family ATPase [Methylocystis parvus OBBP]
MNLVVESLVLLCKQSEERVHFGRRLSFFHGEMSTGKSTIAELIDYCLGGSLQKTPAIQSELVGVQLQALAGDTALLIERNPNTITSVEVSWEREGEVGRENLPLQSGEEPIIGNEIYNYSDFLLRSLDIPVLKVRKRKGDPESALQRLSFRDFYRFCYLDQPDLDSSFFLLDQPIRQEKSKDVLRYVLGFHSDRLNELQAELSEVRQKQRTMREAAKQIDEFLHRYGFASKATIEFEIDKLNDEEEKLDEEIENQGSDDLPAATVAEEDQYLINALSEAITSKAEAIADIKQRLKEQESLIAEFIAMKFKLARSSTASELLKGAAFHACPACGTEVSQKSDGAHCVLCKSDLAEAPGGFGSDNAVMERDLSDRIDDLKRSVQRLKRSHDRQSEELSALTTKRADAQRSVDFARRQVESEYIKRARRLESRRGAIRERRSLLVRIMGMPGEVEGKLKEADTLSTMISKLEREIQTEQGRFEAGRENVNALEKNFHALLRAIHFPEIKADDKVFLNQRSWFPYLHPKGNESLAWTFSDAGSGGKMVLFKICFALALHQTAAQRELPLPRLIVIDSPMKNITPDVNPEIFSHFYTELYRLLESDLKSWQCIMIDQTLFDPPSTLEAHIERLMTNDNPDRPPLIGYYRGH